MTDINRIDAGRPLGHRHRSRHRATTFQASRFGSAPAGSWWGVVIGCPSVDLAVGPTMGLTVGLSAVPTARLARLRARGRNLLSVLTFCGLCFSDIYPCNRGCLVIAVAVLVATAVVVVRRAPCRRVRVQLGSAGSFDPADEAVLRFVAVRGRARRAIHGLSDTDPAGWLRCSTRESVDRSDRP